MASKVGLKIYQMTDFGQKSTFVRKIQLALEQISRIHEAIAPDCKDFVKKVKQLELILSVKRSILPLSSQGFY